MLGEARAMLAFAEEAEQRVRNDQTELRGHLRLFATVDFGQFLFTRIIASFMQRHPTINVELIYSNRPLRMIEEGCDAGLIVGDLTDETVAGRQALLRQGNGYDGDLTKFEQEALNLTT